MVLTDMIFRSQWTFLSIKGCTYIIQYSSKKRIMMLNYNFTEVIEMRREKECNENEQKGGRKWNIQQEIVVAKKAWKQRLYILIWRKKKRQRKRMGKRERERGNKWKWETIRKRDWDKIIWFFHSMIVFHNVYLIGNYTDNNNCPMPSWEG